jgi:hypothetical protein
MIIDCDSCVVAHTDACDDCIVTALCEHGGMLELGRSEKAAIDAMSDVGLVAPLRLVIEHEGLRNSAS